MGHGKRVLCLQLSRKCHTNTRTAQHTPGLVILVNYRHGKDTQGMLVGVMLLLLVTDACSGIEAECLQQDMASHRLATSCRPLQDGAECGLGMTCSRGCCRGETYCTRALWEISTCCQRDNRQQKSTFSTCTTETLNAQ